MTISILPIELIEQIADQLEYESEINAFARSHSALYHIVNPMLYKHNVRYGESSALGWGIMHQSIATVQKSLEAGASADTCDPEVEWRPMALAVIQGNEAIVRYLYQQGVDIRRTCGWENPRHRLYYNCPGGLLFLAVRHGHEGLTRFFMEHLPRPYHVDSPASWHGKTPLMEAAEMGHLVILRLLVDAGANIHAQNGQQMTPLALAAQNGHHEVVQVLLRLGADPTTTHLYGCYSLCLAAYSGNLASVQCLLRVGVIENSIRRQGSEPGSEPHSAVICPLAWSTQLKHDDVVDLLLEQWDYVISTPEPDDKAALLCVAAARGNPAMVRDLLESHGYDPNARIIMGQSFKQDDLPTAICWAASRGHTEVVEVLLAHGAEVSPAPGRMRLRKPLFEAIDQGSEAMVSLFLRAGADPNDHREAYDWVVDSTLKHALPFEGIFRSLLAAGADPAAVDSRGDSLAALVLASGQTAAVQMLIDQGLDLLRLVGRSDFLHQAIRGGRAVLELLLGTRKWDTCLLPDHLDRSACEQALGVAASTGKVETVQWLLDRGFPVRALSPPTVHLLANAACAEAEDANVAATIDLLLQHGLDINEQVSGKTALMCVDTRYNLECLSASRRVRMRMLLDRGAELLPPQSLPQATRYDSLGPLSTNPIGRHRDLDELIFQELEARREPWAVVEWLFRWAENSAREREDWQGVRMVRQYSWRVRYPV